MKKKRAILSTGAFAVHQKRGPIRSAETLSEATSLAKEDLKKLEKHYNANGIVISESDTLLWSGDADPIFDKN